MVATSSLKLPEYLPLVASGKVREIYELNSTELLFITSDRISAFDVVLNNAIDQKGSVLTQISGFWFRYLHERLPQLKHHLISMGVPASIKDRLGTDLGAEYVAKLEPRTMVVKKIKMLPIESIVRGYITGSLWTSYKKGRTFCGIQLPEGLQESQRLEEPLWTPSTKAEGGAHDENITHEEAAGIIGAEMAKEVQELSYRLYEEAREYAAKVGIIIADTKFEFGMDESTTPPSLVLADEVLTPDSSRFWDGDNYQIGRSQESFDKQYLRDWLSTTAQKGKEHVTMPEEVVQNTALRYKQAFERLTRQDWRDE